MILAAHSQRLRAEYGRQITHVPAARPPVASKTCLEQSHSSEKINALLESCTRSPYGRSLQHTGSSCTPRKIALHARSRRSKLSLKLENQNWEAHYNLAIALISKGDQTEATRELRTAIQQKPDSVSSHFALGSVFEDEKKLSDAEEQFRSTLKIDPRFAPGALKLSEVLIAEGKQHAAVDCLEEALRQNPSTDQVGSLKAALGLAYAENGEVEKGQATLADLVTTEPNSAGAHFNLGLLFMRKGQPTDLEAAAKEFREALRLDDTMNIARIALGRALNSLRKYSEAIPVLVEYTRREPKDAQGFYALGTAYQGLNKSDVAIEALRRASVLNLKDAAIRFDLGMLLASTGQTGAGIRELEAAERINPSAPETHRELALLLEKTGNKGRAHAERAKLVALKASSDQRRDIARLNEQANQFLIAGNAKAAAENYRKAVQRDPLDAKLHYNLSLALDRLADVAAERKELLRAVELDPSLALAQNQLGLLALHGGQQSEAEIRFQKALEADPEFAEAQSNLGVLYSQQGKNADAATRFQNAIKTDPKYSKAYVNYGLLLAQQGALAEAEQQLRAAIQVNSNDADAYGALGMLLAKTGRGDDALQCFRKAVRLQPASAQAHLNLGIALVDQFDRPGGFEQFSEAARLDPKLAAAHYNLGRFYFETGKYEDADRELETAARLQSDSAATLYFLALTAKQENQPERSNKLLERVVALQPDNADAQYLLGQNLEHSGDSRAAIQHWKAALQADPNHSQALYNLARSLDRMHDPDAKRYRDRFEVLQKNQQIADRVSELGNFALEAANAQNWPQALEQMNEAIQLCGACPQSAHLHKNLGLFYGRTGNISEAKKELRTALQLTPEDADAKNALAAIERANGQQVK